MSSCCPLRPFAGHRRMPAPLRQANHCGQRRQRRRRTASCGGVFVAFPGRAKSFTCSCFDSGHLGIDGRSQRLAAWGARPTRSSPYQGLADRTSTFAHCGPHRSLAYQQLVFRARMPMKCARSAITFWPYNRTRRRLFNGYHGPDRGAQNAPKSRFSSPVLRISSPTTLRRKRLSFSSRAEGIGPNRKRYLSPWARRRAGATAPT